MSTLQHVTEELYNLRRHLNGAPIGDTLLWDLCRTALGSKTHMPKDEIPRRIASVVDQLIEFRVKQLEGKRIECYLTDEPGDSLTLKLDIELQNVPMADVVRIKKAMEDGGNMLLNQIKANYVPS